MKKSKIKEAIKKSVLVYYKNGMTNLAKKFETELIKEIDKKLNRKRR